MDGLIEIVDSLKPLKAVVENKNALNTMVDDYVLQVIVGVKSVEDHDAFVQEWLAAGGQACEEAYNEWYQSK